MTTVLWILGLLAALVVAVFAGQNAEQVRVDFLVWQTSAQLPVVIFVSAVLGAVVAGILGAIPLARTRIRLRHLTAELAQARSQAPDQGQATPAAPADAPQQVEAPAEAPSLDAALAQALGEAEQAKPGGSA